MDVLRKRKTFVLVFQKRQVKHRPLFSCKRVGSKFRVKGYKLEEDPKLTWDKDSAWLKVDEVDARLNANMFNVVQ